MRPPPPCDLIFCDRCIDTCTIYLMQKNSLCDHPRYETVLGWILDGRITEVLLYFQESCPHCWGKIQRSMHLPIRQLLQCPAKWDVFYPVAFFLLKLWFVFDDTTRKQSPHIFLCFPKVWWRSYEAHPLYVARMQSGSCVPRESDYISWEHCYC